MLSLERCRELIGQDFLHTDLELERLREELYSLAALTIDSVKKETPTHLRLVNNEAASTFKTQE